MKQLMIFLMLFLLPAVQADAYADEKVVITRNPFTYGKPSTKKMEKALDIIILKQNETIAMIDGKKYKVGDTMGRYKIIDITIDYVDLQQGNNTKRLYIQEQR